VFRTSTHASPVAAGVAEQRYARGSEPVNGEQVVIMAWRGLRAQVAGALRWLRRLGLIVTAFRRLWTGIARGWRWLTGSGWDRNDVAELYGRQANRGYGAGLGDVLSRRESDPARPQRAERHKRPGAGS
jgi:hypothetical protein